MLDFKNSLIVTGFLIIFFVSPVSSFAQSPQVISDAQKLSNLRRNCDRQVERRINSLNQALRRVNSLLRIPSEPKVQFSNTVQSAMNSLKTIRVKCQEDKDLATLRADYQSIFAQHRVYSTILPQSRILVASATVGIPADKLNDFAKKLKLRIEKEGNPAELTKLLSDLQSKIDNSKMQQRSAMSEVSKVSASNYAANQKEARATLQKARVAISEAIKSDRQAWFVARQIWNKLRLLNG